MFCRAKNKMRTTRAGDPLNLSNQRKQHISTTNLGNKREQDWNLPVSPLIVIPCNELHIVVIQSNSSFGIEDTWPLNIKPTVFGQIPNLTRPLHQSKERQRWNVLGFRSILTYSHQWSQMKPNLHRCSLRFPSSFPQTLPC